MMSPHASAMNCYEIDVAVQALSALIVLTIKDNVLRAFAEEGE